MSSKNTSNILKCLENHIKEIDKSRTVTGTGELGQESELHSQVYLRQQLFGPVGVAFQDSPTAHRGRTIGGQRRPAHLDS